MARPSSSLSHPPMRNLVNNNATPIWAIVPASGIGQRMPGEVPKQYLQFCGKSILEHTLDRLMAYADISGLILVLRSQDRHWEKLNYQSEKPLILAPGGQERRDSVYSGLLKLLEFGTGDPLVVVHDAVRPLVLHQDIEKLIAAAKSHDAGALLGVPVADTLKQQDENGNILTTVPRAGLWRAFTPQVFKASLLYRALQNAIETGLEITDDASAVEALGMRPKLVAGSSENIKITRQEDLILVTQILLRQQNRQDL